MVKTILIPTDFSVKSLNLVKYAMNISEAERVKIILLYGISLPDSITEMLFFSKRALLEKVETEEFISSCKFLQNKFFSRIVSLSVDIFTGNTQAAFENYVEGNEVDEAYVPTQYKWQRKHKRCFDLLPYFRRSDLPCTQINWEDSIELTPAEADQLEMLFFQPQQNQ